MYPIKKSNRNELFKLLFKIAATLVLFILVLLNFDKLKNLDVRALVDAAPSFSAAVFTVLGVYALKGLVFVIPASLIYLSVGMAFSPLAAVLINLGGILTELVVSYLFGLFLGGDYIQKFLENKKGGKKILEMQNAKKNTGIFLMRFIPAFPIDFVSLFLGGAKTPFLPYLLFSFLGIAPRVILFTLLGDKIYDLIPMRLIILCILIVVPILLLVSIIKYIQVQKKKKAEGENEHADK